MNRALAILAVAFAGALALAWPTQAHAYAAYYDTNCAQCHGPTRTCSGCHAHGAHADATRATAGAVATTSKAAYAAGEDVVVTLSAGYRCGWTRFVLLDDTLGEVARSSGPGGLGNGADSCTTGGILLRASAPTTPGTYTWYAGWYGNQFDVAETQGMPTTFGALWKAGPGSAHGRELVAVTFTVTGGGAPVATLSSASLNFPRVAAGATRTMTTQIQNPGTAVLQVTGISRCATGTGSFTWTPGASASAPIRVGPGGAVALDVTYQPPAASGGESGCLQIATNSASQPVVQLTVTGAADPPPTGTPAFGLSSASLSFGTGVVAGSFATRTFDVTSTGTANLEVTSVAACAGSASSAFKWTSPLPGTIAPTEKRTVTVYYTPTAAGSDAGCLTITTNAGAANVALSGSAVMPAVTCTSCHGGTDNATGAPPTDTSGNTEATRLSVGAHSAHVGTQLSPTVAAQAKDCTSCHESVKSFTDPLHRDGSVDVPFGGLATSAGAQPQWDPAKPSCGAVYCHGSTMQGGSNTSPTWNQVPTSTPACDRCHGTPPPPSSGHPAVAADLGGCVTCHPDTMSGATIDPNGKHINGVVDVVNCTGCHGDAARLPASIAAAPPKATSGATTTTARGVGAHQQHLQPGLVSGAIACSECHNPSPSAPHPSGVVEMRWGSLATNGGSSPQWDGATCANVYCHGGTALVKGGAVTSPTWTKVDGTQAQCGSCHGFPPPAPHAQSTTCNSCHPDTVKADGTIDVAAGKHVNGQIDVSNLTCTSCHGTAGRTGADPYVAAAPPVGTKGETATTARAVGAHQSHLQPGPLSNAFACTDCHTPPTSTSHSNGAVELSFSAFANPAGVPASQIWNGSSCASTYCHGNFKNGNTANAPTWTGTFAAGATTLACTSCHGSPPGGTHPANTACQNCHDGYTQTTVNVALHVNGTVDVVGLTCTSCHGTSGRGGVPGADANVASAPPADSKGNTAITSKGVGVHQSHVNGTRSRPVACAECHAGAVPTSTSHSDGVVQFAFGTLARTGGVAPAYTLGSGGSCAATYCHGNFSGGAGAGATPAWTAQGTLGCTACHGNPPALPHPQDTACADCHGAGYSQTQVVASTHVDGAVTLVSARTGCTQCHGDAARSGVAGADANVKAAPPIGSKGETATTARAVGAHVSHLNQTTFRSTPVACSECHAVPVTGDKAHANGTAAVAFGTLAKTGGLTSGAWNGTTCANVYCHGGTTGGSVALQGGSNTAPAWTGTYTAGQSTLTCGSCHGAPPTANGHPQRTDCGTCHGGGYSATTVNGVNHMNGVVDVVTLACNTCHGTTSMTYLPVAGADTNVKAAPPVDSRNNSATTAVGVGVHQVHVNGSRSKPVACAECHVVPTVAQHEKGVVNVTFGALAKQGGAAPAYTVGSGGSCAATYCHGNFTGGAGATSASPAWTAAGQLACTACHGNPPTANGHPQDTACADCHGSGYSQTTVVAATHVDGTVTLLAGKTGCTACHGDGTRALVAGADANTTAAPPIGTRGETATSARAVGAHQAHLNQATLRAAPIACAECHAVPAAGDKAHANGTAAVVFGTLSKTGGITTAAWNTTTLSCASTYCHGNFKNGNATNAPAWSGGAAAAGCTSCHGSPPGGNHPANTACGNCHDQYTATTVNKALHINGAVDVINMTCTSCHGDSTNTRVVVAGGDTTDNVRAAPPTDAKGNSAITARGVGVHQVHVNGARSKPQLCSECHVVPTSTSHSDNIVQTVFARGGTFDGAALTCASTYCHGNFTGGAGAAATPAWTAQGTLGCAACHGNPPALPHPQSTACADCHGAGYSTTTVNAATHVDGAVTLPTTAHAAGSCTACHGDATKSVLATADANAKAAPPIGTRSETATTARAVGAHAAHLNQTTFRSAPLACTECHAVPAAGDKAHANGTAAMAFGTLARTGGAAAAFNATNLSCASVYCHGGTTAVQGGATTTPGWTGTFTAGTSTLGCTSCHGAPPTANGHPQRTDCTSCHPGTTTTPYNVATHIDGKVDVLSTIGCTTCHGTATRATVASGVANQNVAPPMDTKGGSATSARGVGAHVAHVNGRSKGVACTDCHGALPTSNTHENGSVAIALSSGTYDAVNLTCASTYCHGNFTGGAGTGVTPAWTVAAGTLGCNGCHGNPPALPHPQDAACADCHGAGYSQTTVNAATHVDGAVTLPTAAHAANSCTACHGDNARAAVAGADANLKAAPPLSSTGQTATTASGVGAHQSHLAQTKFRTQPIACSECHTVPATGDKTHANGSAPVVFGALAKTAWSGQPAINPAYSGGSCGATYCHGNFPNGAGQGGGGSSGPTAPAAAPTSLAFGSVAANSLTLSWTAVTGATSYKVERAPNGSSTFAQIGTSAGTSYADAGLSASTTFQYRVRATNDAGDGPYSATASQATTAAGGAVAAPTAAPSTPTFSNVAANALTLAWGSVSGATSYKVERAPSGSSTFVQIGTSSATSYADAGLAASTTYQYRVRATNDGGDGPYSATASQATAAVSGGTGTPVATRYDLAPATATSVGTDGSTNVTSQTSYDYNNPAQTFRAMGVAGYTLSGTQGRLRAGTSMSASTTYTVVNVYSPALTDANRAVSANVPVSVDYYVRTGVSGSSATVRATLYEYSGTTGNVGAAKGTWTSSTISTGSSTSTYTTLTGTIPNAAFQATAGNRLKLVLQVVNGSTSGNDVAILFGASRSGTNGQTYFTPSLASVGGGTTPAAPTAAPTTLAFSSVAQSTLTLSWSAVSGATHYQVERAPDVGGTAGTFAQVGTTAATSYGDAGLAASTVYWYRVRGWNAGGSGPYSTGTSQATAAPPSTTPPTAAPGTIGFSAVSATTLSLSWATVTGATHYKVERAPDVGGAAGTFAQVGTTATNGYGDAGLTASTKYWYRVRAWNVGGDGPYSTSATQTTAAAPAPAPAPGAPVWAGTFSSTASTLNCQSCHGMPPAGSHPTLAAGTDCGSCHPGYAALVGATTGTIPATGIHMNGVVDGGGEPSVASSANNCGGCHGSLLATMNSTSTKLSKHTVASDASVDGAQAWNGANLQASVPAASRSCVNMCHTDHPHTSGTGATHNTNVVADATTQTTRAGTRLATDFDSAQTNGGLCTSCHQKPVDANSPAQKPAVAKATFQNTAHDFKSNTVGTTTYTWQYTLHDGSAFQRDCTKCHASQSEGQTPTIAADGSGTVGPHASDFGQLLAGNVNPGATAASLICFNCHGNATTGKNMSGKDIATEAVKAQGHGPSIDSSTAHDTFREATATYNSGAYSGANRHANCLDCHDEHMAGKTKHVPGTATTNAITSSSPLYGASGVAYTGTMPANWAAIPAANLAKVAVATAEYQICFKCHTGWAFGTTPPTGPSTLAETDLAVEFNVNNKSVHPVVNSLANQTGSTAKGLVASQLVAPWNASPGTQTMTCSDCHNTDAGSTAAQGPHGSAVRFMLTGTNRAWPYTVAGGTSGTLFRVATSETGINTANGLFCRNCHPQMSSAGSNSLHRNSNITAGEHGGSSIAACTSCHLRIPHGGKVSRLLVTTNAAARYKVGTANFGSITKGANKDSYSTSSFPSGFSSSCSKHSGTAGAEAW